MSYKSFELPDPSKQLLSIAESTMNRFRGRDMQLESEITFYVGHALSGVPEEVLRPIEEIKEFIISNSESQKRTIAKFYGLKEAPNSTLIVETDLSAALSTALTIGIITEGYNSYGLGMEMLMRAFVGLPLLMLCPETVHVSRMVDGLEWFGSHVRFSTYRTPDDALSLALEHVLYWHNL